MLLSLEGLALLVVDDTITGTLGGDIAVQVSRSRMII